VFHRFRVSLETYFEFQRLKTDWKTEIIAGATTFITMAYIVVVNPSIFERRRNAAGGGRGSYLYLRRTGHITYGRVRPLPIALAPGMGLNAYFTYSVVKGMGVPWQTALGAVFLSGVAFLVLTALGIRQWIVSAIPAGLYAALSAGIGLFIAFIGLRNAGLVQPNAATIVSIGNLRDPNTALAAFGIL